MIYLSWDIGIINLSYCLVEYINYKYNIIEWENINISLNQNKNRICEGFLKNKNKCNSKALFFTLEDNYYCKKHKTENSIEIKSKKCVYPLCKRNKKYYTNDMIKGYCKLHKEKYEGNDILKEKSKRSEFELISEKLVEELDARPKLLDCDIVLIENQPAIKNPKMKSIQMIIYSYFLIRGKIDKPIKKINSISFLLASNKLKIEFEDKEILKTNIIKKYKNKYKQNKELSKEFCNNILNTFNIDNFEYWINFFKNSKKKDDLADTFLMIIYSIQKK